jgi:small conductance mechanosensitive channel
MFFIRNHGEGNMDIKITSLGRTNLLALLLIIFALSSTVFADSDQDAMIGKTATDQEEIASEAPSALPAPVKKTEEAPKKKEKPKALSIDDISIPQDELKLFLKPFSTDELKIEADAWFKKLQEKATEVTSLELVLTRLSKKQNNIQEGIELLSSPPANKEAKQEDKDPKDPQNLTPEKRLEYVKTVLSDFDSSIDTSELSSTSDIESALNDIDKELDSKKEELAEKISNKIEQRSSLVDRLNIVLNSINATDGIKEDSTDNDAVVPLRRYIKTVTGLHVDTNDAASTMKTIKKWIFSKKGGKHWLKNITLFIAILFGFWILSRILSTIVHKMLKVSGNTSALLHNFLVGLVRKVMMLVGIIMSLAALEINVSPILAVLGALGFILAFALQGTISNFASGLLMLVYRPFDVGDSIEAGGVNGIVESMSLVSTYIKTPDNQHIVVPNNTIWGGPITNSSSANTRRIDLTFTVNHKDNADNVTKLLDAIAKSQALVLTTPAYSVGLDELAEAGMVFSIKTWVNKDDYGTVKSAITHDVKRLFDSGKINMPS